MESPTFLRLQLGHTLRELRLAAGVSLETAAEAADLSDSSVSRIERGQTGLGKLRLNALLDLYEVTDSAQRETLHALAAQGKKRGWLAKYAELPATYRRYIGLEEAATLCRNYEALVIPGLLQTEDYMRAVILAVRTEGAEPWVQVRLARQQRLRASESLLRVETVIDESALHRRIGGEDVMRVQLDHLVKLAEMPNVDLRVLPLRKGGYAGMVGAFSILTFPSPVPEIVCAEGLTSDIYQEGDDVRRYTVVYDNLRAAALDPANSVKEIERVRDGGGMRP